MRPEFVQHLLELADRKYEQAVVFVELIYGDDSKDDLHVGTHPSIAKANKKAARA